MNLLERLSEILSKEGIRHALYAGPADENVLGILLKYVQGLNLALLPIGTPCMEEGKILAHIQPPLPGIYDILIVHEGLEPSDLLIWDAKLDSESLSRHITRLSKQLPPKRILLLGEARLAGTDERYHWTRHTDWSEGELKNQTNPS